MFDNYRMIDRMVARRAGQKASALVKQGTAARVHNKLLVPEKDGKPKELPVPQVPPATGLSNEPRELLNRQPIGLIGG